MAASPVACNRCRRYNPRNLADRAREIYCAAPGNVVVYFDVSQGEPRVAAFLSGDPERIKTTYGDVHAENAKIAFPDIAAKGWLDGNPDCAKCVRKVKGAECSCPKKDPARGKPLRDLIEDDGSRDRLLRGGRDGVRLYLPEPLRARRKSALWIAEARDHRGDDLQDSISLQALRSAYVRTIWRL